MTRDQFGFTRDNQWTADRIARLQDSIDFEEGDGQLFMQDLVFLQRLCTRMYAEDRFTGDQMRNIAQRLDRILESLV